MTTEHKRILFISPQPFFQWRGSPIRVGFNLLALSQLGYEVDLLTLPFGEDRTYPGVRVIRVRNLFGLKNIPIGPSIWKLVFDLLLYFKARRLIREKPYDVIHAIEDAGFVAIPLARQSQAKLIFEKHSDPGSYRKKGLRNLVMWLYGKAEACAIRQADAVIGTGTGLVEQARQIDSAKACYHIFDIPSSLAEADPEPVQTWQTQLRQQPDEILVAYVGSFAVYQGIELIFAAIPEVVKAAPQIRFVIVGGTQEEIQARTEALRQQGADRRVTFLGKIPPDELPNLLAAADILLSSRIAGTNTPLKLLDYLKAGRCILATDIEANRQILDGDSAHFVSPNATAFAQGILDLAKDPERRERLAAQGGHLIRDTYNFTEYKRRLAQVYADLDR